MYTYLQQKPQIGIASGIGAGLILRIQHLLTDDYVLKLVSGVATWAGCIVAVLSVLAWLIKIVHSLKIKRS